jgi:hypothetical protein
MAMSIFLVLTILGGWFAWRRNPMYSAGKTVQVIFLFGGTIVVVLAALGALILWTEKTPTPVVIGVDVVYFFAGLALIIWVSMKVFNPAPAALPEGTKLVNLNRRRIIPWLKALAYVLAAMGIGALFLSADGREIMGIFAAIVFGFSAFMAMAAYMGGYRLDRALTAVLVNPWVHWTYSREQWEAWTDQQVARLKSAEKPMTTRSAVQIWFVMFVLLGVPSMFAFSSMTVRLSILGGAFVLVTVGTVFAYRTQGQTAANYRKKLLAATPEAFFAPDGLFVDGEYCAWLGAEIYLLSASIEQTTPPCVSLHFERVRPAYGGPQTIDVYKRVMIPAGAQADLAKLQNNLTAICHKARVSLV